ncbi:MAG: HIT domain-containing protein [Actinobacteria bacterium]|nr:HIT domain-containing protein [Actinomycetota bacterium]
MDRLYGDRMQYLRSGASTECFLCEDASTEDPPDHLVLERDPQILIVMNRYPYNSGHLLVAPLRHVGDLEELKPAELSRVMEGSLQCLSALRQVYSPQGFNVGFNLGSAGGAGVPAHLHLHVVPRWTGDTNFMPVVGETKVLPEMLADTYAKLRPAFTD